MRTNSGTSWQAGIMGSASGNPAKYIALSTNATAPAATDTSLAGELTAASGGLIRAACSYAFTSTGASAGFYTLTHTYTANANDGTSNTIQKIGVFDASSSGTMVFETAMPNPPTLVPGDSLAITETVTI